MIRTTRKYLSGCFLLQKELDNMKLTDKLKKEHTENIYANEEMNKIG